MYAFLCRQQEQDLSATTTNVGLLPNIVMKLEYYASNNNVLRHLGQTNSVVKHKKEKNRSSLLCAHSFVSLSKVGKHIKGQKQFDISQDCGWL